MMKLLSFRVTEFRSVTDSGWIDADDVTALIGTNESGKTNLLLPLWKLNPAKDGEINPTADFPRKRYSEIRAMQRKPIFIRARFLMAVELRQQIAALAGITPESLSVVEISRDLGGQHRVSFPDAVVTTTIPQAVVAQTLGEAQREIDGLSVTKAEESYKDALLVGLKQALDALGDASAEINIDKVRDLQAVLEALPIESPAKKSSVAPRFGQLIDALADYQAKLSHPHPDDIQDVHNLVIEHMPAFVYYSNYGNLDSEIYLPHVIQNLNRPNLGSREEAKVRTLKVLFNFVKLEPQEILELGRDAADQNSLTQQEIDRIAAKKKERDILLQSAGTELTLKFRDWWKQGEYRFRFQADGDHFRIWVSDDKRPEDIELEGRSTGLQWFLSFYLIFLVESAMSHKDAILLLDEPGVTLHPIAQKHLSAFFENLSATNQILYTTHSPFLVDADHLDRVKAVYVGEDGTTKVSSNLRAGEGSPNQSNSIYPVHAALGLSVSDALLQGCQVVIVEGPSDQHYLSAIKNNLIGKGLLKPKREIVFIPSGGVRGVAPIVSILGGKNEALPFVVLDADSSGRDFAQKLTTGLYKGMEDRVISIGEYCAFPDAEIEDLFPLSFLAKVANKFLRGPDEDFQDVAIEGEPIVRQIEKFSKDNDIRLLPGWKVEIAAQAKSRLLREDLLRSEPETQERWVSLFNRLNAIS